MDIRTITEIIKDDTAAHRANTRKRNAFADKALADGYTNRTYWITQYAAFMAGNRGPNMHDFTLANLGRRAI